MAGKGEGASGVWGEGRIFFSVRPFVLKVLVSVTHFYACSKPPGEKAAINVSGCRQEVPACAARVLLSIIPASFFFLSHFFQE